MVALQAESGDAYGSPGAPGGRLPVEAGEKRPQTQEEREERFKLQSEQRPVGDENFLCTPVNGRRAGQRRCQTGAIEEFARHAMEKLLSGKYDRLLIESCCEGDSTLSAYGSRRSLAIRVTENLDCAKKSTARALHSMIRVAAHVNGSAHAWVSIPCIKVG